MKKVILVVFVGIVTLLGGIGVSGIDLKIADASHDSCFSIEQDEMVNKDNGGVRG